MIEILIDFLPDRANTGSPVESHPKPDWLKKGDLVHIDLHVKDDAYVTIGREYCPNTLGRVALVFRGGKLGDAKCNECSFVKRVGLDDRIRKSSR